MLVKNFYATNSISLLIRSYNTGRFTVFYFETPKPQTARQVDFSVNDFPSSLVDAFTRKIINAACHDSAPRYSRIILAIDRINVRLCESIQSAVTIQAVRHVRRTLFSFLELGIKKLSEMVSRKHSVAMVYQGVTQNLFVLGE